MGAGPRAMLFAHGFGCDQAMWRHVAPEFEDAFSVVTFDHVGSGGSDSSAYDPRKYSALEGYAEDVVEIGRELGISGGILVGHSVSAMICALASIRAPGMFDTLVMVCPSPSYIDDGDYIGGFSASNVEDLLAAVAANPMAWSATMAPAIMGNPDRPELGEELTDSFCRLDPRIASDFARATFTADNRADLLKVTARTLILQCHDDIIAAEAVGEYVREHVAGSTYVLLDATGHCPNLSAPDEVVAAIREFL
ncbi:alpha/beta hydrolase [Cereibacter sp. SYSU M97828]|nr:alpha/beta hydrolase [Cereibacter flavus]